MNTLCPCGSENTFQNCCQPFIQGQQHVKTPEQLMRSRFSAYKKGEAQYLLNTLHPSKREENTLAQIKETIAACEWLSLKIINTSNEKQSTKKGTVEFTAFYYDKNNSFSHKEENYKNKTPNQLHEKSEFIFEQQWFYTEGKILPPIKLKRNDKCWCGSNKKLKACHGK